MSRPSSLRPALLAMAVLLATAMVAPTASGGPASAAPAGEPDPLLVDIGDLSPSVVPTDGSPLRIVGTITNQSTEEWNDINLHAVTSDVPMTGEEELSEAAASDPMTYIGDRITEAGTFDTVDSLLPGETEQFSLTIPRSELDVPTTPGVYWLGVHALGDSSLPRDDFADGRTRIFVPQLPPGAGEPPRRGGKRPGRKDPPPPDQVRTSVVVPLRASLQHGPLGRVMRLQRWTRSLSPEGRLHDLLDLAEATDAEALTWLVDPAVPAAVARIAAGNPERSLAPTDPTGEPGEEVEEAPDADPSAEPDEESGDETGDATERAAAEAAGDWLARFEAVMADRDVLALPYGDLDVNAAAQHAPDTLATAVRRSREVMADLGIDAPPALASPDGLVSRSAIGLAPSDAVVMVEDAAFEAPPTTSTSLVSIAGRRVLVTDATAASPTTSTRPNDPVALRQRLLSEAALAHLAGDPAPVVAVLADTWHPEDTTGGLLTEPLPWLETTETSTLVGASAPRSDAALAPTQRQVEAQLGGDAFVAAAAMRGPAGVLDGILTDGSDVEVQVTDEALTTLSHASRLRPRRALGRARAARAALEGQLRSITLEAPDSVTMSSATGSFATTITNGLDQSVTVRVAAISDGGLEMAEEEVVDLAPLARTRLILDLTATRTGMHDVRLVVTDEKGRPLGSEASLPIRAAQVSRIIWAIMAGGALLLFGAIAVRLVRRLRGRGEGHT